MSNSLTTTHGDEEEKRREQRTVDVTWKNVWKKVKAKVDLRPWHWWTSYGPHTSSWVTKDVMAEVVMMTWRLDFVSTVRSVDVTVNLRSGSSPLLQCFLGFKLRPWSIFFFQLLWALNFRFFFSRSKRQKETLPWTLQWEKQKTNATQPSELPRQQSFPQR